LVNASYGSSFLENTWKMRTYRSEENKSLQKKIVAEPNPFHEDRMNAQKQLYQYQDKKKIPKKL
jgi:hypothetical protein